MEAKCLVCDEYHEVNSYGNMMLHLADSQPCRGATYAAQRNTIRGTVSKILPEWMHQVIRDIAYSQCATDHEVSIAAIEDRLIGQFENAFKLELSKRAEHTGQISK